LYEPNVYDGQLDDVSLALGRVACCGILQRKRQNMRPRGTGSGASATLVSDECCIMTCRFATERDTHYRYRKTVNVVEIVQANSKVYIRSFTALILLVGSFDPQKPSPK